MHLAAVPTPHSSGRGMGVPPGKGVGLVGRQGDTTASRRVGLGVVPQGRMGPAVGAHTPLLLLVEVAGTTTCA